MTICPKCHADISNLEITPTTACPSCGIIITKFQANIAGKNTYESSRRQTQSLKIAERIKARELRTRNSVGFIGFITFRMLITPDIVSAIFWLSAVLTGYLFVYGLIHSQTTLMLSTVVWFVVSRLLLEAAIVIFRMLESINECRDCLEEMALNQLRPSEQNPPQ